MGGGTLYRDCKHFIVGPDTPLFPRLRVRGSFGPFLSVEFVRGIYPHGSQLQLYNMYLQITYIIYFLLLLIYLLFTGLNFYRLQAKGWIHPQVVTLLLPFIANYFAAKFVFERLNPFLTMLLPCLTIYFLGRKLQTVRIMGLTGGIASGKSTLVNKMKESLNDEIYVIDCDAINKELSAKGNPGFQLILSMLAEKKGEFLSPTGDLNRQKFSDFVFRNPDFRRKLTMRMGRKIMWRIITEIYRSFVGKRKLVMIDAPILYETKYLEYICFPIIVVGCPTEVQIQRMVENRGMTEDEARARIGSQMPIELKKKKADIYVENTSTPDEMFTNTLKKLNKILAPKKK